MIAVSNCLPFASTNVDSSIPGRVHNDDINLIHSEPGFLIVKIAAPRFQAVGISIHGLDKDHGEVAVSSFWKRMGDTILRCISPGDTILCGIDGNCRIGLNNGPGDLVVGSFGTQAQFCFRGIRMLSKTSGTMHHGNFWSSRQLKLKRHFAY